MNLLHVLCIRGGIDQLQCKLTAFSYVPGTFFKWVDKPSCPSCGSLTFAIGVVPPTPEEMAWGAGNVESYKCVYCGKITRFPRYNHPAKLLGENVRQHLFSQQFIFIEQIDSLLPYVCTAIDHR